MSITLAINTASSQTSIALLKDGKPLNESSWTSQNDEAEKLMPEIAALLQDHSFQDITQVLAISGPGSFTGLRVGITAANTIAYLNQCPLYAINTFYYWHLTGTQADALLIFAGKGGVYFHQKDQEPEIINLPDLNQTLQNRQIKTVFGDISPDQKAHLTAATFIETQEPFAQTIARLNLENLAPQQIITPNYIKQPAITKAKNKLK